MQISADDLRRLEQLHVRAWPAFETANIHGWLGDVLIWLAGLHAAAAFYHHYWRRDTVLLSMLPGR